jgi:hypothetical protein
MSYHIVKRIEIDKQEHKVYITGSDNNVYPRTPHRWHCSYYDKLMQTEDWQAVELDILEAYISGNFKSGVKNKYSRAVMFLRRMPEFAKFDWRQDWDNYQKNKETKKEEYSALLKSALIAKLPKDKYIIAKEVNYEKLLTGEYVPKLAYLSKRANSHYAKWYYEKAKATKFSFKDDAENLKKYFTNSKSWQVIKL